MWPSISNSSPAKLDVVSLIDSLAWPVVVLVLAVAFGGKLLELLRRLAPRLRSFSFGGFALELATVKAFPMAFEGAVDLRHAGQSSDIDDSTLRSFYEQIRDPSRVDYVVADLGQGSEWLSSRLYILSVIMSRMRGLKIVVFVETAGHIRRRFVGLAECEHIRWRLAAAYPWLEAAFAKAANELWGDPQANNFAINIASKEGRLEQYGSPDAAADLLKDFLKAIQGGEPGPTWVDLISSQPTPVRERAQWLSARDIEEVLGDSLTSASIPMGLLQAKPSAEQAALIMAQEGRWIALVRDDSIFDRLIDRDQIIEEIAKRSVATQQ